MAGWVIRASGDAEDPAHHKHLLEELANVLGRHDYGTGSSEFTSAHVQAGNFHEPDGTADTDAGAPPDPGAGQDKPPKTAGAGRRKS